MPSEAYPIRDEFMAAMQKDIAGLHHKKKAA